MNKTRSYVFFCAQTLLILGFYSQTTRSVSATDNDAGLRGIVSSQTEGKMQEWLVPTPYSAPYDAIKDRNNYVWTGSMTTDKIARLNLQNNQFVEYLLPSSINIKRVLIKQSTPQPVLSVGNNHGVSIAKLETLN